jgi:hypothetical protein
MTDTTKQEFVPFPAQRIQQLEERRKAAEPYHSPHHPLPRTNPIPGIVGADMKTNFTMAEAQPATDAHQASPAYVNAQVAAAAPIAPQIPVVVPGFTTPTSEEEAVPIALPSGYAFYDFKDLYIKPFKGRHMAKLSRAREEGSTLYTVEAVSAVLSTPQGHTHLAFQLTVPDFYYVLYWLRLNSFTKTAFMHKTSCANEKHIEAVAEGKLLKDTLVIAEVINRASMQETNLKSIPNKEAFKLDLPGAWVKVCTMQDALEMTEDAEFISEEFRYAAEIACYLDVSDVQNEDKTFRKATLRERIAYVDEMSPDDIQTVKSFEKAVTDYGIIETISVTCKHCGQKRTDAITLDAHSFFPSAA